MNGKAIRYLLGLLIIGVSALAVPYAFLDLVRIGSCGSQGVYVAANECPPGTGEKIVTLMGGISGLLLGGALTARARGMFVAWGLGFATLSAALFVSSFGPAASPDLDATAKGVSVGVGSLFALLALPALLGAVGPAYTSERRGFSGAGRPRRIVMAGGSSTSSAPDFWSFGQDGSTSADSGSDGSGSSDSTSSDSSDSGSSGCSSGCGGGCGGGGD